MAYISTQTINIGHRNVTKNHVTFYSVHFLVERKKDQSSHKLTSDVGLEQGINSDISSNTTNQASGLWFLGSKLVTSKQDLVNVIKLATDIDHKR